MIVLRGTNAPAAAAQIGQGHVWKMVSATPVERSRDGQGSFKRQRQPPLADDVRDGMDVSGVWSGSKPPWVSKVSSCRALEAPQVRQVLSDLRNQNERNLMGCWSREHAFRQNQKTWFNVRNRQELLRRSLKCFRPVIWILVRAM